jgi:2-polyprenyl-6-methoxyphenol hydroxylase-like FAD-dependent oxidoreductase
MRGGVLQLARWGLLESVLGTGSPLISQVTFRYPDAELTIDVDAAGSIPGLLAPKRTVLDPILSDAAEAAGAHVRFGARVERLLRDGEGRVTGVAGRDGEGRAFTASAPITVGADGIRSFVARSVDAPILRAGRNATAVAYAYFAGIETRGYEWCWAPGLAAGVIPTNDGHAAVFVSVPADEFRTRLASDVVGGFHQALEAVRPDVAARVRAATPVGRFRTFPGLPGFVRRSSGPGWALVGDAGYWKDPIGAHGLTDALRDAELLATAVDRVLVGAVPARTALDDYEATRDRLSTELFDVVEQVAGLRWTIPELQSLLIGLSKSMDAEVDHLETRLGVPA